MKVIILNGSMGIGKTTVGTCIADRNPGTAFIDGDWCMDIHPFVGNRETKKMAVDNILHMIRNYRDCAECNMIVLAWLMDDAWVYETLTAGIREAGLEIKSATLICNEDQLRKQWIADKNCPWRTEEWLETSIRSLAYFSKADNCINTDGLSVEEVADRIEKETKMDLNNVYFVIGTSYAGKSTIVKNLAKKHNGIALEENYHDEKLPELDSKEFPGLTYTRDLQDWHEFIRRTPEEYFTWLNNTKKECEIVEFQILEELLAKPEVRDKKIFVDTNICIETLHRISDTKHVLVMLSDPEISIRRFFDRPDPEKQFLYQLMLEEPDPQAALDNYREILTKICSKECYDELENSGFKVIYRDEKRSEEETVRLAEELLEITD